MILVPLLNLAFRSLTTAFGRFRPGPSWRDRIRGRLRQLRHDLMPTDAERDSRYLDEACDLYDLEHRIRELDRPRQPAPHPFHPLGDRRRGCP
ncbi:DUF3563 family protein [Microvirga lenta]|uniref:DUF3563 family protein n=1 Tax=Microvirga lenta TaxID=2881337 RepID=UPI001CFDF0C4|nr:DUF3563 family protein [Microvirga lenta]MCB5173960.1 DUF3563 domain-containing protein [Microvirga lenta]